MQPGKYFTALTLLLGLSAPLAHSQDKNVELMKKLYTKIGQTVGVGENSPTTGETFLVLANTGILLDPNLNYNIPAGRYQLSQAVDKVLNPNWIYGTRNYSVFDLYNRILNDHEAAEIKPTADQIKQYKAACKVIFTDCDQPQPGTYSAAWDRYSKALRAVTIFSKQAEDYKKKSQSDDLPPELAADLEAATNDLDLIGNKPVIEAARATINTFEHIDPNAFWGELIGRFQKNAETYNTNRFGTLNIYPSYPVWLDPTRTWTNLTLSQSDIEQTTSSSHTSVGGGASFNLGLFSVGGNYNKIEDRTYYKLDGSGYSVSMELMRVAIDRPWMDESVFESHAWRWLNGTTYYGRKISSGADAASGQAPPDTDLMPFIPTGLLLARKVSLSAGFSSDLKTSFNQHTEGGGSVGWGPFSLSGRYVSDDANTYHKGNAAGNTVTFDAPQIIGFFVQVLPQSPTPDRCYHFPSSTTPVPADCNHMTNLLTFNFWRPTIAANSTMVLDNAKSILRNVRAFRESHR